MSKSDRQSAEALQRVAAVMESSAPGTQRDTSKHPRKERLPLMAWFILFAGTSPRSDHRALSARRALPIRGYVGPNGGGKSLAMVHDILPSLDAGRTVLSTVKLLGPDGRPHPSYVPFTDFAQLLDAEHCDVLMDEIVGIANSRESAKMPAPVQNLLVQLRRRDITLSWSAPNWARSDKIIREVTQAVTECRGYFPGSAGAASESGVRLWAPNRVFKFRTFDTAEFEEWTAGKRDSLKPLAAQWFKGPGSRAFSAYDTLDSVSMVAGGDPDVCQHCGKKLRAEYCKGHGSAGEPGLPIAGTLIESERLTGSARGRGLAGDAGRLGLAGPSRPGGIESSAFAAQALSDPADAGYGSYADQEAAEAERHDEHDGLLSGHGRDVSSRSLFGSRPSAGA